MRTEDQGGAAVARAGVRAFDARAFERESRQTSLSAQRGARLMRLIFAKSMFETVFVVALLTFFSYTHFNPHVRGSVDVADERTVAGWAVDESAPLAQLDVQLFIDGHFVAQRRADGPRADVFAAGRAADPNHGFIFEMPSLPPRESVYEVRVYALSGGADREHLALQQIGQTARFRVAPNEGSARASYSWREVLERR